MRADVKRTFKRFPGQVVGLASELGIGHTAICNYLAGKSSQRIDRAAKTKVLKLLRECTENVCPACEVADLCVRVRTSNMCQLTGSNERSSECTTR